MTKIFLNGEAVDADQTIEWEKAIEIGGFYFERARDLGLPKPPAACLVECLADEENSSIAEIAGAYHERFKNAEERQWSSSSERGHLSWRPRLMI